MSPVFRRVLIGIAIALSLARVASAHPAPFSYLDVVFKDGGIEGTLVVHVIDVAHELGVAAGTSSWSRALPRHSNSASKRSWPRDWICVAIAA